MLHQLKRCLEDDDVLWHDVPLGPHARQSDLVGLAFLAGLQAMPLAPETLKDAVRQLDVGMTRATRKLVLSAHGNSPTVAQVRQALDAVARRFSVGA